MRLPIGLLILAFALAGCDSASSSRLPTSPSAGPQPTLPQPPQNPDLRVFTDSTSGFSTSEVRDAQQQIVQFSTANELIWTADGTRLPGYRISTHAFPDVGPVSFVEGEICPEGCAFEIRFGTTDGERRAYLTVDYGHFNPGTLVDVEGAGDALVVSQTNAFPPGTLTLSGLVTEETPRGQMPVEGVSVYRIVTTGWQTATTDSRGFYRMQGLYDGTRRVAYQKEGYEAYNIDVMVNGNTLHDIQLVRR